MRTKGLFSLIACKHNHADRTALIFLVRDISLNHYEKAILSDQFEVIYLHVQNLANLIVHDFRNGQR